MLFDSKKQAKACTRLPRRRRRLCVPRRPFPSQHVRADKDLNLRCFQMDSCGRISLRLSQPSAKW